MNYNPPTKPRLPRIEHEPSHEIEDDAHGWAVSYADFLMVLLSFFILFFSTNNDRDDVIRAIAAEVGKSNSGSSHAEEGGRSAEKSRSELNKDGLKAALAGLNLRIAEDKRSIQVIFPDHYYLPGSVELSEDAQSMLDQALASLKPYISRLEVTFVGHTDGAPVKKSRRRYLQDNFDLSVLRATKALQYALSRGLPVEQARAQGSAQNLRNSRSLSLVLRSL